MHIAKFALHNIFKHFLLMISRNSFIARTLVLLLFTHQHQILYANFHPLLYVRTIPHQPTLVKSPLFHAAILAHSSPPFLLPIFFLIIVIHSAKCFFPLSSQKN